MTRRDRVRKAFLEIVDNQLSANNPPETKQTLDRLIKEGYSRDEARRLISCVVAVELSDMLRTEQPFDEARFISGLDKLPKLPE